MLLGDDNMSNLKKDVTTNKTLMALQSGDLEQAQNILKYLSDTGEKLSNEDEKMLESIWDASDTQQYSEVYNSNFYGMYQQKYLGDPDGGDGNLNPSEWAFF